MDRSTSDSSNGALKDIGIIYSRLLEHHPVIQSEISYCLKEFESKRNDRERQRLEGVLEMNNEMRDILIPESNAVMEKHLPHLRDKINIANRICAEILAKENCPSNREYATQCRAEHVKEWTQFMDKMCEKSAAVDLEFANDVKYIGDYYKELEQKLKIT